MDGYNLPMRISNNKGCPVAECAVDLGPDCPAPLKGPFDSTGFPVGCKSACVANVGGNQGMQCFISSRHIFVYKRLFLGNSPNCCTGSHNLPQTCPPSGVAYYDYFKSRCPRSYVYAYDESSGTALWTCPSTLRADYTLTFCP